MSNQVQIQTNTLANPQTAPQTDDRFKTRGFSEKKQPSVPKATPDLKTQLQRASRFGNSLSKISFQNSSPSLPVQTKAVNLQSKENREPEPEAEQMKSESQIPTIQAQEELEEEPEQMKSSGKTPIIQRQTVGSNPAPTSAKGIPSPVRAKMEKSFNTNFSDVQIHTNSIQASSIGALAYTQGNNIHFAPGQYNPGSSSGQSLLGHELTHVVQQRAGRVPVPSQSKGSKINADPGLEREADLMGAKAARGDRADVPGQPSTLISGLSPVQNSTKPVQFFLPERMGLVGGGGEGRSKQLFGEEEGSQVGGTVSMVGNMIGGVMAGSMQGGGGGGGAVQQNSGSNIIQGNGMPGGNLLGAVNPASQLTSLMSDAFSLMGAKGG